MYGIMKKAISIESKKTVHQEYAMEQEKNFWHPLQDTHT